MERIVIELVRSGGFAGMTRRARIDTGELDEATAATFIALADQLDLAALGRAGTPQRPGADRFQYDITIIRGGERRTVHIPESGVTMELQKLIDHMLRRTGH